MRSKTCSFCGGTHAILDCIALPKAASEAKVKLADWEIEGKAKYEKAHLYSNIYKYRRDATVDWYSGERFKIEADEDLRTAKRRTLWSTGVDYDFQSHFDHCPDTITCDDFNTVLASKYDDPSNLNHLIRQNERVQERVRARAKKSCSYCRTSGHTVRTCTAYKNDNANHHLAFKITAYRTAEALARFGIWTGALALREDSPPLMCHTGNYTPNILAYDIDNMKTSMRQDTKSGEYEKLTALEYCEKNGMSVEDLEDFWHVKSALEGGVRFTPLETPESWKNTLRVTITDFESLCFNKNCLNPMTLRNNSKASIFKSTATVEHIYCLLAPKYKPSKKGDKHYNRNRILAVYRVDSEAYLSSAELYSGKKERDGSTWTMIEKYIKNNQDIVNKIDSLSV